MSTGTVTSEFSAHPDLYEPDDQWKADLKETLSIAFKDMLLQAKQKLEADLQSLGDDIDPVQKKKLIDEYQASERQIKSFATQSFKVEVEKEREQRRWAAGLEIRTAWKEDLESEQQAIMSGIRRQRTGSAGAESNVYPKGRDRESTVPDRLPDSHQHTIITMPTPTPTSTATRPSPIPIPTPQRRSSTSGTPGNSVSKNPEVWIPPKSAAEDKPMPLGRRTSQTSIGRSASQTFRPSAPIPEAQKPPSNTDSRTSSSYVSKTSPLPEIPKHATTEYDHPESRTSPPQTSRPSVSTLENRKHPDRDSRLPPSYTRPSGSIPENNRRPIPEHVDLKDQSSATRHSLPIHVHENAERERARIDEADQSWASHNRAKGKGKEVENDQPPSPAPRSVSVNQDVGRPPTPPMATKPAYTPSLLTTSRPSSITSSRPPATLRQASSSSDGYSLYRQPSLDASSSSSYRQPSVNTSSSSLSRQPSMTFSHNNPNHHPHPRIPEFPPAPVPVDGLDAYRSRHTLQSPSHSQTVPYPYHSPQTSSYLQHQPFPPTQVPNPHSSGGDPPAWKLWENEKLPAEPNDDDSESLSEDDEAMWRSRDRVSIARKEMVQDDVHQQEAAPNRAIRTTKRSLRREVPREEAIQREEMSRWEEEQRKEEVKRKEEENKRNELETRRKAEEAQRKAEEARRMEEEAEKKAEEARRIEAETEKRAAMLREREEALRQREQELEKREREAQEAELKRKEEELKRREEEIMKKEAEDLKRRREELERKEAETRQKAEQERLEAEAAKAREREQIQKDKELAERMQREQNEESWKEKERANKIRLEAERRKAEENRKAEERRKAEDKRKLEEFQAEQTRARRKEEEAKQQQANFQRREEEIRRKRQDSWTFEDTKARSASGWGSSTSASSSSSAWSSSTASNPTSGWKQTTPSSNRTSTSSSTPGYKPRSGSSSYSQHQPPSTPGTPQTPGSDAEWRRRQEEQARAQQEKFRAEQERLERERQAKEAGRIMSKEEVVRLFQSHESQWQKLTKGEIENVIWDAFPWPMIKKPKDVADINAGAIHAYVLNPHFPNDNGKGDKDKIKEQIRRWHPDRFERLMPRVAEDDRDRVREGAGEVVRGLNDLLTKFNGPAGMFG